MVIFWPACFFLWKCGTRTLLPPSVSVAMSKVSHTAGGRAAKHCSESSSVGREDRLIVGDAEAKKNERSPLLRPTRSDCETADIFLLGSRRRVPGRVNGETRNRERI